MRCAGAHPIGIYLLLIPGIGNIQEQDFSWAIPTEYGSNQSIEFRRAVITSKEVPERSCVRTRGAPEVQTALVYHQRLHDRFTYQLSPARSNIPAPLIAPYNALALSSLIPNAIRLFISTLRPKPTRYVPTSARITYFLFHLTSPNPRRSLNSIPIPNLRARSYWPGHVAHATHRGADAMHDVVAGALASDRRGASRGRRGRVGVGGLAG